MAELVEYEGHKSKGHWNVSLWINNEEHLYVMGQVALAINGWKRRPAARTMAYNLRRQNIWRTPDGFKYTVDRIYEALDYT